MQEFTEGSLLIMLIVFLIGYWVLFSVLCLRSTYINWRSVKQIMSSPMVCAVICLVILFFLRLIILVPMKNDESDDFFLLVYYTSGIFILVYFGVFLILVLRDLYHFQKTRRIRKIIGSERPDIFPSNRSRYRVIDPADYPYLEELNGSLHRIERQDDNFFISRFSKPKDFMFNSLNSLLYGHTKAGKSSSMIPREKQVSQPFRDILSTYYQVPFQVFAYNFINGLLEAIKIYCKMNIGMFAKRLSTVIKQYSDLDEERMFKQYLIEI